MNETNHNIVIPPSTTLAEMHAVQQVMGKDPPQTLVVPLAIREHPPKPNSTLTSVILH